MVNVGNPNKNASKVRDVVNVHQKTRASTEVASLPASRIWYRDSWRVLHGVWVFSSSPESSRP